MKIIELLKILDLQTKLEIRTIDKIILQDYPFTPNGRTKAKIKNYQLSEIYFLYPKDKDTITIYIENK